MRALVADVRGYITDQGAVGIARDVWLIALGLSPLWLVRNASTSSQGKIAFCMTAACLVACFDHTLWQQLKQRPLLRRTLAFTLGLAVASMLLRRSIGARWWIIDDHEIADALAVGKVGTLKGLWNTLISHREIGAPPWSYPRYRPSYYTLRYLETYLWGFEAWRWYLLRIVLLGVSFALSWQALLFVTGPAQASLTLLLALSAPFWADAFCRLGPSEPYALLGCALFVYGASASLREIEAGRAARPRHWSMAAFGSVIASGSKENFVFVPGLLALLTGIAVYRRRLSKSAAWLSAFALGYAAWVMLVVVISVRRHGATVYGTDASLGSAPELAFAGALSLLRDFSHPLLVAFLGAAACVVYRRTPGFQKRFLALGAFFLLCASIYGLQAIIYKGKIDTTTRYAFPAGVLGTLMVSLAFAALRWEARATGLSARLTAVIDAAVLASATYLLANAGFRDLKLEMLLNVARTQNFSQSLDQAVARLRAEPKRPLLFSLAVPDGDLEPVVSMRIYFEYYGVTNPMFISVAPEAEGRMAPLMRSWSEHGLSDWQTDEGLHARHGTHAKFLPLRELSAWRAPFGIALSQPPPPGVEPLSMGF